MRDVAMTRLLPGPKALLLAAIALSFVAWKTCAHIDSVTRLPLLNPYFYDIVLTIGINIILAVGLNLVNGYTGQFSLGHAGFMAVGAYLAAAFTTFESAALLPLLGGFQS